MKFAAEISAGRKVLDIGGQKMPEDTPEMSFSKEYAKIAKAAGEYRIVDYQRAPTVNYVVDFNKSESIPAIRRIIAEYKPDVILCMETLEHINYHHELMNELARGITDYNTEVFITLPNNDNWVIDAMGWNNDHSIVFIKDVAKRFVMRSDLGTHNVAMYGCFGRSRWYWWIVYTLALFQPLSWGFHVTKKQPTQESSV
jgi:hypothetical protein